MKLFKYIILSVAVTMFASCEQFGFLTRMIL